jgi:hypothetical protein
VTALAVVADADPFDVGTSCRQCVVLAGRARSWLAQMASDLDEADRVIARLRADNARLYTVINRRGSDSVRALRVENNRLRDALVAALAENAAMRDAARVGGVGGKCGSAT